MTHSPVRKRAVTTPTNDRLDAIAIEIKRAHADFTSALKRSFERAASAGKMLIEAKGLVSHGQWLPWLEAHAEISERTARRYMRIARGEAILKAKSDNLADLTMEMAVRLLDEDGHPDAPAEDTRTDINAEDGPADEDSPAGYFITVPIERRVLQIKSVAYLHPPNPPASPRTVVLRPAYMPTETGDGCEAEF